MFETILALVMLVGFIAGIGETQVQKNDTQKEKPAIEQTIEKP